MSEYIATVTWERGDSRFTDNQYSRGHTWSFDGGLNIPASSSPDIVPLPYSIAENVDPEEAFVASISSCHMLFFLTLAAGRGHCGRLLLGQLCWCFAKEERRQSSDNPGHSSAKCALCRQRRARCEVSGKAPSSCARDVFYRQLGKR